MLYSGTDPASYITEYTLVYEDKARARFTPRLAFSHQTLRNEQFSSLVQYRFYIVYGQVF